MAGGRWLESQTDYTGGLAWLGREREDTAGRSIILSLSFSLIPFVKGDSCPELCAHRTDEGVEFLGLLLAGSKIGGGGSSSAFLLSLFKLRIPLG
jgi:hypothetical protein